MRSLLVAVLALPALLVSAQAEDKTPDIVHYTLENGLEVVLAPDDAVPKVVLDIVYRVGSLNEPPGRSGFAHLFEHLMFAGTPAYPNIDAAYGAVGVEFNAWTYEDKTLYYAEGLSSTLPFMLALEADRMANQGRAVGAESLAIQRDVVLNELRQNTLDTPAGAGWAAFDPALYPPGHPYSRAVIGSIADLEAATLDDVRGFFATYYVPNNAILTLVGDFDVADARALIEQTMALVPRGADVIQPEPVPVAPARARLELEDAVSADLVISGWTTPPYAEPANAALRLATDLLGHWEYGFLKQRMVDTGLISSVYSWVNRGALGGRYYVELAASEGVAPETVETAFREALAEFAAAPIDPADLERARRRLMREDRLHVEPLKNRAEEIAVATQMLGDPAVGITGDASLASATAADVSAAVQSYLTPDDASIMVIRVGPRGELPPVLTASSGTPVPFNVAEQPSVTIPPLPVRVSVPAKLPERQEAMLGNGMRVVHYPMPDAAMAYVGATVAAGMTSAPQGKEGLVDIAVRMAVRGADGLDYAGFAKAAKDVDGDVDIAVGDYASVVYLSIPATNLAAGVPLLADAIRRPEFLPSEWDVAHRETLYNLGKNDEDLSDVARRATDSVLFPAFRDPSVRSVRDLTGEEAKELYASLFVPSGITFYSVGPTPMADVVAALEAGFGDWQSDAVPIAARQRTAAAFPAGQRVLFVPKPGATQSVISIATPAPGVGDPGFADSIAVARLLGDDFISRINAVIREQKGYSYGTDGSIDDTVATGSLLTIDAPVERDHTADALTDMLAGYATLVSAPVSEDEVSRTVTSTLTRIAGTAETAAGLFETIRTQLGSGASLESEHARRLALAGLGVDTVRTQAVALSRLEQALIVVVGDPDSVLPQLEGLGLTVETIDPDGL